MKRLSIIAACFLCAAFASNTAHAENEIGFGPNGDSRLKLVYEVGAKISFDNTEYSDSKFLVSRTLFGIRANASLGLKFGTGEVSHRIIGGVSPLYDFGGGWKVQPLLYYKVDFPLKRSNFSIVAGAFSRKECKAFYSMAFFSNYNLYTDGTFEGVQFSWSGEKFHYEVGVDWMGMIGPKYPSRREEFKIYSGGSHNFFPWFKLGYAAYLHHYASSVQVHNVVDDAVVNPYAEFEFAHFLPLQSLLLRAGVLAGYQNDRRLDQKAIIPVNGNIYFRIRKWNVILDNEIYFGTDMLPLYDHRDGAGNQYGENLYMSDPLLRRRPGQKVGYFDRLGIAYEPNWAKMAPNVAPYLKDKLVLRLRVNLDFNAGYAGTQQLVEIAYTF